MRLGAPGGGNMWGNRHLSRMWTTSLATVLSLAIVLLMSACSGHNGTSQSGRSAPNTLSRTHPLKVQYALTSVGEGDSGPVRSSMTLMTDGRGKLRVVFSPGSYEWFFVSDGHRAVDSLEGDELEEAD